MEYCNVSIEATIAAPPPPLPPAVTWDDEDMDRDDAALRGTGSTAATADTAPSPSDNAVDKELDEADGSDNSIAVAGDMDGEGPVAAAAAPELLFDVKLLVVATPRLCPADAVLLLI